MTYLSLTWLTLRNRLLEESRYPLQFFFNTVFFIGVAYMLALGGIAIQGGGQIEANIAAFFLAFLAGAALGYPLDALGGVHLEEFYLKPLPSIPR